jgi:hypothetical protein
MRTRLGALVGLAASTALLAGGLWLGLSGAPGLQPAALAAPPAASKPDTIRPLHRIHVQNDVECETCHGAAATSAAGTDNLLPTMDTCGACHDVADDTKCGTCHTNVAEPVAAARRVSAVQKFSHQTHLADGMQCTGCHRAGAAGEPSIPEMARCRSCHETASALKDCEVCHAASEPLRPVSHAPDWKSLHGVDARLDGVSCESCHTQKDCQDCHSGDNVRPRSHRLNFAFDHALEARGNELSCRTCHEDAQFCSSCHTAENVLPRNHSSADWVLGASVGGGRHAEEARFDLESCVSCHAGGESAPVCADCHGK